MKIAIRLAGLALKQLARHRTRSLLTMAGVATGMFLFTTIETTQHRLRAATIETASDTTLIVYRQNRFCPATSRLPEHYAPAIRRMPGVREVIPVQIVVNNCGASLDVITFRGVPADAFASESRDFEIIAGSLEQWQSRDDAALVGEQFATRRRLEPGDTFEAVGIRVHVAGIVRSPGAQENNVAHVALPFLQQAARTGLGTVTQFNVKVDSQEHLDEVAAAIDEFFATDAEPTDTRPEKAFFAQSAQDLIEIIGFTRWLGLGAVIAVVGLVANALLLVARSRVRENAILQTLGFPQLAIGLLVLWEGSLLGLAGGVAGSVGAAAFLFWYHPSMGNEGLILSLDPSLSVVIWSIVLAVVLGAVASLWPAWIAARHPIVSSLRSS